VDSTNPGRINFTFDLAYFLIFGVRIPYPVPFRLLGDEAKGWLENTYVSERVRISRGNKGTVFILTRAPAADSQEESRSSGPSVVVLPGLGNDSGDYDPLVAQLAERGFSTTVVPVARLDWLRNALGLLDLKYWLGTLEPRPVLDWYLERVEQAVQVASDNAGDRRVVLLGHSAVGWLAR
jgi:pimeloyl-ACP methyl ester carboxylesterase